MGHYLADNRDNLVRGRYDQAIATGVRDVYYEDAANVAFAYGYASSALLQRKLDIGYFRAQTLVEALKENGVVDNRKTVGASELVINWQQLRRHLKAVRESRTRIINKLDDKRKIDMFDNDYHAAA